MKNLLITLHSLLLTFNIASAQNVGVGTTTPAASAVLDVNSTSKGFLLPRMTTAQKNAIINPAEGLEVYDLTLHEKSYYNGSVWTSSVPDALPTIQIGTQKWMSKNLDVAFYRNGDPIPLVRDPTAWVELTTGAWCYYNNDSTTGTTYGKLYNWYAVNDPRGLAPQGWHIPSTAEWNVLSVTLNGDAVAGGKMKEAGTSHWINPNTGGNNNVSFTGLPGGYRGATGPFFNIGGEGFWWSSKEKISNTDFAFARKLSYDNGSLASKEVNKTFGCSVRCLRD